MILPARKLRTFVGAVACAAFIGNFCGVESVEDSCVR